ncbi:glutathione ABC transporter ATP-binding protein [Nocardioides sp. Root1257]|uniref:dipeptide ABC transporter ATP-binding protein n=1 Tax=unclassified Nocardioides TaxID=2615069 RepID=UPI0006F8AF63|nr:MULTISPECIES: ABC transporter ATP-binding protein [unclassified Nocardioides]KQW47089.1 glutathione ABC transporter ATP-binding protein [Nocardioides sp. Root1257]KRC43834.1 glutathione ABC transporter ATP-binding protein [Nocardioides sp. Root224]
MTTPLLEVTDLAISFSHPRPAVRSVSVTVDEGEVVALVGESGSGKSMTARAVIGLLPDGAKATGSVRLRGEELLGLPEPELIRYRGRRVAMVFQEPQTALNPVRTIGWQIGEALRAHGGVRGKAARARAVDLLREVEIPDPEERLGYYPHQLSGGQKQRVVLALALANEPELLLADEPTTALDVTVQAEILALLRRIRDRTGTSILIITHNMGVVAHLADRVVVLRQGEVVEEAATRDLFADPRHAYTRQLLAAVPRLPGPDERVHAVTDDDVPAVAADAVAALEYDDVRVHYGSRMRGRVLPAVDGVTLRLERGQVLGLVGESGSGKTTLGRLAAGLVPLAGGSVRVGGEDLVRARGQRRVDLRRRLAFVHQDPEASLDPRFSIAEAIREPLDVHAVGSRKDRDVRVTELLDAVRLPASFARRRPRELSGGQRQRVALARALTLDPELLIADEPTSALDVSVQAEVLELFADLQQRLGFACVFISHDLAVVNKVADQVAVLRAGRVVESGSAARVFGAPTHDYTRQLLAAVPVPDPTVRDATGPALREQHIAS